LHFVRRMRAASQRAIQLKAKKVNRLHDCSKTLIFALFATKFALILKRYAEKLEFRRRRTSQKRGFCYYRKIVLAQAVRTQTQRASSGRRGCHLALESIGIENKIFDSAIVSQGEPENPANPNPQ